MRTTMTRSGAVLRFSVGEHIRSIRLWTNKRYIQQLAYDMPALESRHIRVGRPVLGHVNLMVDTFIANTNIDDLRAIVRSTLASSPPAVASAFTAAARHRLVHTNAVQPPSPKDLFIRRSGDGMSAPSPELRAVLARARMLYGSGMGFASFGVLAAVVRATTGYKWDEGSEMENTLAAIDADISQAIQSAKEEIGAGRVTNMAVALEAVADLRTAIQESWDDVQAWGGMFPFERGAASLDFWKL